MRNFVPKKNYFIQIIKIVHENERVQSVICTTSPLESVRSWITSWYTVIKSHLTVEFCELYLSIVFLNCCTYRFIWFESHKVFTRCVLLKSGKIWRSRTKIVAPKCSSKCVVWLFGQTLKNTVPVRQCERWRRSADEISLANVTLVAYQKRRPTFFFCKRDAEHARGERRLRRRTGGDTAVGGHSSSRRHGSPTSGTRVIRAITRWKESSRPPRLRFLSLAAAVSADSRDSVTPLSRPTTTMITFTCEIIIMATR